MTQSSGSTRTKWEWMEALERANKARKMSAWLMADILLEGLRVWDEPGIYDELSEQLELAKHTLQNYASCARRFPPERRHDGLEIGHHVTVLGLDDEAQDYWLAQAYGNGWSVGRLRSELYVKTGEQHPRTTPIHVANRFRKLGMGVRVRSHHVEFDVEGLTITATSDTPIVWRMQDEDDQ